MKNILFIYHDKIASKQVMMASDTVFTKLLNNMSIDNIHFLFYGSFPFKCIEWINEHNVDRIYLGMKLAFCKKIFRILRMKDIYDYIEREMLPYLFLYKINNIVKSNRIDKLWFSANNHIMIPVMRKYLRKYPIEYHMSIHDDYIYDINMLSRQYKSYKHDFIYLMQNATSVDLISPYMEDFYKKKYMMPKYVGNIWAGYLDTQATPEVLVRSRISKIAYVGSIQTIEEHELLHKVIGEINDANIIKKEVQLHYYTHKYNSNRFTTTNKSIIFKGICGEEKLKEKLKEYDLLLVVMSFDQERRIQMSTSFPSKVLLYLGTGVPLFALAPCYSSVIQFMKTGRCELFCTNNTQMSLRNKIETILNDNEYVQSNTQRLYTSSYDKLNISRNISKFSKLLQK